MNNFLCVTSFSQPTYRCLCRLTSRQSQCSLTWLLQCFEGPAKECNPVENERLFQFQDDDFSLPLKWLATMIVRSSADIQDLLETIRCSKYLGDIDEARFAEYMKHCPWKEIRCNQTEGACQPGLPVSLVFGCHTVYGSLLKTTSPRICGLASSSSIGLKSASRSGLGSR